MTLASILFVEKHVGMFSPFGTDFALVKQQRLIVGSED